MLRGIDVSNNNGNEGFDLSMVLGNIDFAIMKATGADWFVDAYCDKWVQLCIQHEVPWGFYHFGNDGGSTSSAAAEARFFIDNTRNYFGAGIPVLDWERDSMSVEWVNEFVRIVHGETGVWPWIYANPWRFNIGGVEPNCMRWIASYPEVTNPTLDFDPGEPPATDGLVGCWQYASDGRVPGYWDDLDVNHFFGDRAAWNAYAGIAGVTMDESVLENDLYRVLIERKK